MLRPLASSSSSSATTTMRPSKPRRPSAAAAAAAAPAAAPCRHTHSATLDLLILLLVLISVSFLAVSVLSNVFNYLLPLAASVLAPLYDSFQESPVPFIAGIFIVVAAVVAAAELSCNRSRGRRCQNPRCRGLRMSMEFDVQLQTEDSIRSDDALWKEIEGLPWKGGQQGNNPDYECLRAELRRMAPQNGRAVLLFRARCGCAVAKLEAWGGKRAATRKGKKCPTF